MSLEMFIGVLIGIPIGILVGIVFLMLSIRIGEFLKSRRGEGE